MLQTDIIKYVKSPALLKKADISELKQLIQKFPYYQTAHILLLKSLKEQNHSDFEKQLAQSSIFIADRNILYQFLNKEYKEEKLDCKDEVKKEEKELVEEPKPKKKLLKDQNVKRKINNSFEGMGENISETISSQLELSKVKDESKLEYPSEIYFIEEERNNNGVVTINADPDKISEIEKKKDILIIDDNEEKVTKDKEETFELIEIDEVEEDKEGEGNARYFDISNYADEKEMSGKNDLISKFIEEQPQIKPAEKKSENIDISEKSVKEDSELLSETLIKVYIKQGLFDKAIESYKKLSLKYPEKNAYFASQIEILQEKINKQ